MDQEEQLLISIELLVIILWFVKLTFINKKNYEKKFIFSNIKIFKFSSLIVAIIAILLKFDINLQINYFQFCLFLIVFSNLINIAREKSIIKHPLLYLAYFTCIIYAILIIFIL